MRAARLAALGGTLALTLSAFGCAGSYHVRAIIDPEAGITGLATFRVLPVPPPRDIAELQRVAAAVVKKFPKAASRTVAAGR